MTAAEPAWMIHGVVRADAPRPKDAPPHSRVAFGAYAALVSPGHAAESADPSGRVRSDAGALEREARAALAHNRLLTAYAVSTDVAPVRYGAAVSDPDAARALLLPEHALYEAVLTRVAGSVEYALRLAAETQGRAVEPTDAAPPTGRAYLAQQRGRRDARDQMSAARADCIAALVSEAAALARETAPLPARADRLFELALLVPRARVDDLVAVAGRRHPEAAKLGLNLTLVGPWPPYSFTNPGAPRGAGRNVA
jgi:hypothetical protein